MKLLFRALSFALVLLAVALGGSSESILSGTAGAERPNIIFILTDDLDAESIAFMPQLQSLLKEQGTTFMNFLLNVSLCCPSRASILRGQYSHNTEILTNSPPRGGFQVFRETDKENSTVATWLQAAGYRTVLLGKYLNGYPARNNLTYVPPGWSEWYSPAGGNPYSNFNYLMNENGRLVAYGSRSQDYMTDVLSRKASDFIRRTAATNQPFFVYLATYAPHSPATPAPRHQNTFANVKTPRSPSFNEADVNDKPEYIRSRPLLDARDIAEIDSSYRKRLQSLLAVDDLIAQLIATLKATRQLEKTYIFFTSDNGYHLGQHRLQQGKQTAYEEDIRVPLLVRGPGVPTGQVLEHLTGNIDLAPTFVELAGATVPDFVDGRSLVSLLGSNPLPTDAWRQAFLVQHWAARTSTQSSESASGVLEPPDQPTLFLAQVSQAQAVPEFQAIRTSDYLYVEYATGERELYDLHADPYELESLHATAGASLITQLSGRLAGLKNCAAESCRAAESTSLATAQESISAQQAGVDLNLTTTDGLSLSLSYDGSVRSLTIDGRELVIAGAPALWVRDLSNISETDQPNLVANSGFENGLSSWRQSINNDLTVQLTQIQAHSGTRAFEFSSHSDRIGFAAYASQPMPITPGQLYRVSAWWRSKEGYLSTLSGTPPALQMNLYREPQRVSGLYLQWLDDRGQPLRAPELAVALHQNAASWRVLQREFRAPSDAWSVQVIVAAKLQNETLWVDDVRFIESPEREEAVESTVQQEDDRLIQTAQFRDLAIQVTYEAYDDFIAIHGELQDLRLEDRAFELTFSLPIAARGWRFWDDIHRSRIIASGAYENAISAIFDGWLPISLYPYAGVEDSEVGLAMALPPDRPQLALLRYNGDVERLEAIFHLGISQQATKLQNKATFDLLLYRFDPEWGFRSVIAKQAALFPQVYNTDLPVYSYSGVEQGSFFTPRGAEAVREYDTQWIYAAQYTMGELPIRVGASDTPRPTLAEIISAVEGLAQSPNPWDAEFAQAIYHSAAIDTNGDWIVKHIGIFSWDLEHWEASWAANLDPELDQGLAQWLLNWQVDPAFEATQAIGARLDGVQIDNFMSTPAIDLRLAALQHADHTLTYSPHTYRPGVHNGSAMFEYLQFLREHLDGSWGKDRGISINFWGLGHPNYLAGFIDAFGGEGNTADGQGVNWNPEILDYRRAVAYHKPLLFANQTPNLTEAAARRFQALALLYGIWPRQGPHGTGWSSVVNAIFADTVELVEQYWSAGWEPLTHAKTDNPVIWVERFGDALEQGLSFTVFNSAKADASYTLSIDATALGLDLSASLIVTELISGATMPFIITDSEILISGQLGGEKAEVFRINSSRE